MPGVDPHYLNLVLRQLRASGYFISISQRAVNQSSINQKNLAKTIIPFPPLSEQHRIVIKVDELMQLCDRLEAKRAGGGAQSASGGEPCPPQRTGP
jgi:type I restriction enzyme S subunit